MFSLGQESKDAIRAAIELICGLEVDNTSDDGNGHFMLMGSTEWSLLSDFGFDTPGYPKEVEPPHEVIKMADGSEVLSMEDAIAGKYFDADGRVKMFSGRKLDVQLQGLGILNLVRHAKEGNDAK